MIFFPSCRSFHIHRIYRIYRAVSFLTEGWAVEGGPDLPYPRMSLAHSIAIVFITQ